jgi:hypothetical protein
MNQSSKPKIQKSQKVVFFFKKTSKKGVFLLFSTFSQKNRFHLYDFNYIVILDPEMKEQ